MKLILIIDAIINFILGVLLIIFSPGIVEWLGLPASSTTFYPNILGAVFIGITIALIIDVTGKKDKSTTGLGFLGAISINICGGIMLAVWLLFGSMNLPERGLIFLWLLVGILIVVSAIELIHFYHRREIE